MLLSRFTHSLIKKNKSIGNAFCATFGVSVLLANSFTHGPVIWLTGLPALIFPEHWHVTRALDRFNIALANNWIRVNNAMINKLLPPIDWQISIPESINKQQQYLLLCNHQTWVDTAVMQYIGLNRMPFTRFFTKFELIFIPFVGQAFKILGFPMMKRHSKDAIAKRPELKGQDIIEAKKSCSRMKRVPFTLLNYVEGTRITPEKHCEQGSPYQNLLKPKYGGLSLALSVMGKDIDQLLDMTIVYPDGAPEYMDLLRGNIRRVTVDITPIEIPDWVLDGNYQEDAAFKKQFKQWVDSLWHEKDQRISRMLDT